MCHSTRLYTAICLHTSRIASVLFSTAVMEYEYQMKTDWVGWGDLCNFPVVIAGI